MAGKVSGKRDVGRVLLLHPDHVIPRVDMVDLAGHAAGEIAEQVKPRPADVLDGHVAPERGVEFVETLPPKE